MERNLTVSITLNGKTGLIAVKDADSGWEYERDFNADELDDDYYGYRASIEAEIGREIFSWIDVLRDEQNE